MADMIDSDYEDEDEDLPSPEQMRLSQSYLQSTMKRKAEAEAQMQKLIDALNVRKNMPFDPVMMRVAGALLSPTKTGSFGESLGYATTAAADESEKQAMRQMELAKLEFELGQKRLQQQEASDALRMAMEMENPQLAATLPQPGAAPAPAVPAPAVQEPVTEPDQIGQMVAATSPDMAQPAAAQPEAPVSPLAGSRMQELLRMAAEEGQQPPAAATQVAVPLTQAAPVATAAPRRRTQMITPSGAAGYAIRTGAPDLYKYFQEQEELGIKRETLRQKGYKSLTMDGITVSLSPAEQRRLERMTNQGEFENLNKFYTRKLGIPPVFVKDQESGEWRAKTSFEKERDKALAGGLEAKVFPTRFGPISMLPEDFFKFRKIDELDPDAGERFLRKIVQGEAKPAGGEKVGEKPKILTEDVRKQQELRETETTKEDVKQSAAQSELVQKRATDAFEMREIIDNLDSTAKTNPKVFGLLQGPGLVKSIARAVDQSNSTVKIENIAQYKLSGNDLLALQDAANNVARLQNMIRKAARIPGEGATSDLETRMQIAMSLTTSMSPEIIRLRAEVMRERANFDEKVFELWSKYKKSQKGYFQEFLTESKEYKDLKKNYENKLRTIRDANAEFFANPRGAAAPSAAPRSAAPAAQPREGGSALEKWNR
jgi:hypothetical protein